MRITALPWLNVALRSIESTVLKRYYYSFKSQAN